jgi:hypothetical protein
LRRWLGATPCPQATCGAGDAASEHRGRAIRLVTTTLIALGGAVVARTAQFAAQHQLLVPQLGLVPVAVAMLSIGVGVAALWLNYCSLQHAWAFNEGIDADDLQSPLNAESKKELLKKLHRIRRMRFRLLRWHFVRWSLSALAYAAMLFS